MNTAIAEAQSSLPHFVEAVSGQLPGPQPALEAALVKYAFEATRPGIEVEHVFLGDVYSEDGALWGVVNADPVYTDAVCEGDVVRIDSERVSDWLYVIDGKGVGGFTFKLMWSRFSPEEKTLYGSQPPFIWLVNQAS